MEFSLVRDVKEPVRGTSISAGIDFFVPEFDEKFKSDLISKNESEINEGNVVIYDNIISLESQGRILIPAGVHVNLESLRNSYDLGPFGVGLFVNNKSGVGTKKGFDRLAETIDEDYQGEIHISIVNTGTRQQEIKPGDKIVQMVLKPVLYSKPIKKDFDKLYTKETERGTGGFGSTGDK